MKNLQERVCRLEAMQAAVEDFQLVVVDEDLPDGRMLQNGVLVALKPAAYTLIIHRQSRCRLTRLA
jgi:hypothetical protein